MHYATIEESGWLHRMIGKKPNVERQKINVWTIFTGFLGKSEFSDRRRCRISSALKKREDYKL